MDLTESIALDIKDQLGETDKAWLTEINCGIYWFPKSQCRVVSNKIYIPRWLADSKDIDYLDIDIEK